MSARRRYPVEVLAEAARVACAGGSVADHFNISARSARYMIERARIAGYQIPTRDFRIRQPRVPFLPLQQAATQESFLALARALDCNPNALHDYVRDGVPYFSADRYAVKLGKHPAQIWSDWYAIGTQPDRCAA